MKVLMTADAVGGVWRYSVDLASGLAKQGADILLATLGPAPSQEQIRQVASVQRVRLHVGNYALEWMSDPWRDVEESGTWLLELQTSYNADIVHLNGYSHAALPWQKPVVIVAHSCVFSWWRAIHGVPPGPEWSEYRERVSSGLAVADAIVCPSRAMAEAIRAEYALAPEKVHIIHNFITDTQPSPRAKQPFFLGAGRFWDPAKNFGLLDQIAPKLDWEVRIAGNNRNPDGSTATAKHLAMLGTLDHARLLEMMSAAAVFVHPAFYEPFGLSILEAACAQCCLVLADIPSLRELWDGAAVFLDPRDPEQWCIELKELSSDAPRREHLAALAKAHAAKYRMETSIAAYRDLYTRLIAEHKNKEAAA